MLEHKFYDPYGREWKNGNSCWDMIAMWRLCLALRPEGIHWSMKEDGSASFRLEELTAANGIAHEAAHDALSDVTATIAMAKLFKTRQPKLYDYVYELRAKQRVQAQLDIITKTPVLHVSSMYPASLGCLALVAPLTKHPTDKNGVIVYDLRVDPRDWMDLTVEQIQRRLFTRTEDMPEGVARIPLKVLHANRCPVIVGSNMLSAAQAQDYQIDMDKAREYWQCLVDHPQAIAKVASAFDRQHEEEGANPDPDFMIYSGGFFGAQDKQAMAQIRASSAADLSVWRQPFVDKRLGEMLFRYRARNYPTSLTPPEQERWQAYCRSNMERPLEQRGAGAPREEFFAEIAALRASHVDAQSQSVLESLENYGRELLGADT